MCLYISYRNGIFNPLSATETLPKISLSSIFHFLDWESWKWVLLPVKVFGSQIVLYSSVCRISYLNVYSKRHLDKSKLYQKSGNSETSNKELSDFFLSNQDYSIGIYYLQNPSTRTPYMMI